MQNKFNHPLMEDNISKQDIAKVIKFLKKKPILTQNSGFVSHHFFSDDQIAEQNTTFQTI